jgi:hypothetical protein
MEEKQGRAGFVGKTMLTLIIHPDYGKVLGRPRRIIGKFGKRCFGTYTVNV